MSRHAKASTVGSTQRQATGLGRVFRGVIADRGGASESKGPGASSLSRLGIPVGVFVAVLAIMALVAMPAGAAKTHLFKEVFGSAAQPSFSSVRGIAIDQSSGNVLVMEGASGTIKRYAPDGTPANFAALGSNEIDGTGPGDETPQNGLAFAGSAESQIAIDNSGGATSGNIYVTQSSPNLINIFSASGAYLGQLTAAGATPFAEACGVAVDPTGAVYVGDYSAGIHKFVPAANPPLNTDHTATFTTVDNPCVLAAGAGSTAGSLFATQFGGGISKLDSSSGTVGYVVLSDNSRGLALDPASGHLYAVTGSAIKEFDASGASSVTTVSNVALVGEALSVAVRGATGDLYVAPSASNNLEVFGPTVTVPDVSTGAASSVAETTATLNGAVNPDGVELEECFFEYGATESYGQTAQCSESVGTIGAGSSPVSVHVDVSGLAAGTVYHYRLVASNDNGLVTGGDETVQTAGPTIDAAWAASVARTEATLKARVNPEGFPTTYQIEWGTSAAYGSSTPTIDIGSDETLHAVSSTLTGLQPGTTYHWRLIATNSSGVTQSADQTFITYALPTSPNCPNQAFRIGPAAKLPDCRAYEMVSPVNKNGGDILGTATAQIRVSLNQSAINGGKISYSATTSFGDQPSSRGSNQYMSTRGANGWTTHGINPPIGKTLEEFGLSFAGAIFPQFKLFTPDLSAAWVTDENRTPLTSDASLGWPNLYRRDNLGESYKALTTSIPSPGATGVEAYYPEVQGHSADFDHVVFAVEGALTPDASKSTDPFPRDQLYDYSAGKLHLVSVLPDGTAGPRASMVGSIASYGEAEWFGMVQHAVSDDGSRIFWTYRSGASVDRGDLYVRKNPTQPQSALNGSGDCTESSKACTVLIGNELSASHFWVASADGSKVIYTNGTGPGSDDLLEFDVDTETTRLVAGKAGGVVGASDDASYVYFTSKENLAAGATDGEWNLYLDHDGSKTFIATISPEDRTGKGEIEPFFLENAGGIDSPYARFHAARVTPDGQGLAFMSNRSLTGYDNTDSLNGKPDEEVYLYDAGSDQLACVSCNPSGARPMGQEIKTAYGSVASVVHPPKLWGAAWLQTWVHNMYASRALSSDGNRLFFNSFDPLVPEDTNGAQDVYQWEAQGTGTCEKSGGCIDLISTGQSPERSEFVDATADGSEVFFETSSSIDPRDPGLIDIYVARVNGGFPLPSNPAACEGEACQGPPAPPNDATPASAAYNGPGNVKEPAKKKKQKKKSKKQKQKNKKQKKSKKKGGKAKRHAASNSTRANG